MADNDDDEATLQQNFQSNQPFVKAGASNFNTQLNPGEEGQFRNWVSANKVPFNPDNQGPSDYDMRGFWKGMQSGDPMAKNAVDPNDNKLHYPDYWKTPYHQTFSAESQWANPNAAPSWNDQDQLVGKDGKVLFDDRAQNAKGPVYGPDPEETSARSDNLSTTTGYRGPNNIGSPLQTVTGVAHSAANAVGESLDQFAGAPAGHGEDTFQGAGGEELWNNFQDGLKVGQYGAETDLRQFSLQDSIDKARENIKTAAGVDIPNPYVGALEASPTALQDYQKALEDLLAKHQEDTPGDKAIRDAVEPALNMNDYADQWVKGAQEKAEMDTAKSDGRLLPWLAQQAGQIAGGFRSPINVLGLAVGGPELGIAKGALGRILEEGVGQAITQMGLTGIQEPGKQARQEQLGEDHGFWPIMQDMGDSALGGFIGGGVIKGIHEIGRVLFPDQGKLVDEFIRRSQGVPPPGGWPVGAEGRASAWADAVAKWEAQKAAEARGTAVVPYEGPTDGEIPGFDVGPSAPAAPSPPKMDTPDSIANLPQQTATGTPAGITARELDVAAAPRIPPEQTPAQALETYSGLVKAGENPDVIAKPLAPFRTPDETPASSPESLSLPATRDMSNGQTFVKDGKPVSFENFDPLKLTTNAEAFQYKGGGNAQGVTDRLKGVGQWDVMAGSDPMVVYQWSDGRQDVSNGHQRTGLAKALDAQGQFPEGTKVPGFLFKETDGWTPQDVRAFAAKVNLQQGSGDVLDSARILRERPDIWDKSLPTSDLKLKQAKGLAELSDDGWGMVVNGHVKPNLAALVGQGVPDKSAHAGLLQSIIDFKNADENSTRMMVADANAAGFREENQVDIFGSNPVTRNLLRERAEVYSRVIQALRDDKKVFGLLDREADRIESAGNTLVGDVNVAQADRATQLANILEKLAVRQGPISAALNRAASLVAEGGKAQVAARSFLRDVDRLVREEGLRLTIPAAPRPRTDIDVTTPAGSDQVTEQLRQASPRVPDEKFGSHTRTIPEQRQAIFDDMRQKLIDADTPPVQAEANAAIMAARYVARASRVGRSDPEALYREQNLSVRGDIQRAEGKKTRAKEGDQVFNQPATVPTFYSAVQRAVDTAKLNKGSPEQWLATLKNLPAVKPEEMKWLGLEDWLKGQKGPVTKEAVADYVRANQIQVTEVTHQEGPEVTPSWTSIPAETTKYKGYTLPGGENYREVLLTLPHADADTTVPDAQAEAEHQQEWERLNEEIRVRQAEEDRLRNEWHRAERGTPQPIEMVNAQGARYAVEADRERLHARMVRETIARKPSYATAEPYGGPHWEERNVLAHIRFDDREIGGRALHLAEVQSDWHQKGRKSGYKTEKPASVRNFRSFMEERGKGDETQSQWDSRGPEWQEWRRETGAREDAMIAYIKGVPDAPFKTTWPELSMKRMIRYAAENGYDRLTWDTGGTSAERYDLSKRVEEINWLRRGDGTHDITIHFHPHEGIEPKSFDRLSPERLADTIGKEAAEKILATEPRKVAGLDAADQGIGTLGGVDLKVGGEGMRGFYDKILPAAVNKLVKKVGGKVEQAALSIKDPFSPQYSGPARTVDEMREVARDPRGIFVGITRQAGDVMRAMMGGSDFTTAMEAYGSPTLAERVGGKMEGKEKTTPVHSLTITPELRDAALNEGFPLFAKAQEGARGKITIRDDSAIIDLFKTRNASTFMHEAGHKFLDELAGDAAEDDAPQQVKDDFKTVLDWLGAKDAESITVPQHEKFARGWEQYLRGGKAPSEGLRRVFEQFKDWLRSIYRTLVGLGKEIPDSIRQVMDRMIATDDEIAANLQNAREAARAAPPTQVQAANAQAHDYARRAMAAASAVLEEGGTPLDKEARDFIKSQVEPAVEALFNPQPEPGAELPKPAEPIPMPGTKLDKTTDMARTGLRPKGRADGRSSIGAAQVAWSHAIQTQRPQTAVITADGWKILRPTEAIAYGQPHIEVTPEGLARFYGPSLGEQERSIDVDGFHINAANDVPYGAGASNQSNTVNIDRHIPRYDDRVVGTDGHVLDLWKYLAIHETTEKPVMERLIAEGMPKEQAYHIAHTQHATPAERAAVEKDGGDWNEYEKVMDGFLSHIEHEKPENPPADLYTKPYPHTEAEFMKHAAATEKTAAGEQTVMPGVKPVTDADRARAGAERPMRGGSAAPAAGGLFDEDAKAQTDWLDTVPTEDGLVNADDLREELAPGVEDEGKTFFQTAQTPTQRALAKRQKALALRAQNRIAQHLLTHRTIDGRRDIIDASYSLFEDFGYSGHESVRFIAEALTAQTNGEIADALEHFARKTFYSDGSLVGGRRNRADFGELQRAMFGEKSTPEMQRLASHLLEALDRQRQLFNEYSGGTIGYLANWGGPQSHSPMAVYRAGGAKGNPAKAKANWVSYIDPLLNWTKMRDTANGGAFYQRAPAQAERERILGEIWENIVTDGNIQIVPGDPRVGSSVANSRSDHRFLVFKDADSKIDYNRNYGEADLLSQIAGHIRLMARDSALMHVFGPNPVRMIDWLKQGITKEAAEARVGRPRLLQGYNGETVEAKATNAGKTIDGYYQQFRGDNHDLGKIALIGTILRNHAMGALLGASVIPHAVSNPFIQMTARFYGGVPVMRTVPMILRSFSKATKAEMLRSGLDVEQGAYTLGSSAKYVTSLQKWANATRWFPDRVTHLSGLHPFVEANRAAMRRDLASMLADLHQTPYSAIPAAIARKIKGYGVRPDDWSIAQAAALHTPAIGSADWLRPLDVMNTAPADVARAIGYQPQGPTLTPEEETMLARRARDAAIRIGAMIQGETEVAVPTSSLRARAFLFGDSDPNTFWGFLRRSAGMFKGFIGSFMLTQARANAEFASRGSAFLNPRMFGRRINLAHAASIWIAMSVLGTVTYSLKQMSTGKEPPSLDPRTPEGRETWLHGMLTGGAFGWAGDFLASDVSSFGRGALESLAGPAAATAIDVLQTGWDAFTNAMTKRSASRREPSEIAVRGLRRAVGNNTPVFSTLWYARAAFNRMVLDQLQYMADPQGALKQFRDTESRLLKTANQKFWWKPGDVMPHEYPWQHGSR